VAVLPFANMSNDPEQEFFSDGITEDIITDLSNVSGLFVLGRNTVFTYKGKAVNLEQVARELGVAYVLEGSVRKVGQKVRINAQLIEGVNGGHIWAKRYDGDLTDIFALQDEITHAIVGELKVKLLPEEKKAIAQAPTENVEAYTYYLKGRELFHRGSARYYELAKEMFAKAIALDPNYARAYAGSADCDSFLFIDYSREIAIESILANCAKALELDPNLAEARASRGLALSASQRYPEAEAEFENAIALNSNLFEAHYFFGRCCYVQGKLQETAKHWERASEIKPDDCQASVLLTQVYETLGRPEDELKAARRGVERAEKEMLRNPENARAAYLGANALAKLGQHERARNWSERALAIDPTDVMTNYNVACQYVAQGELDRALDLLENLLPRASRDIKAWVLQDSDFNPLHALPRWQTVLELTRG
jgi:adenylate cyclase